VGEISGQWLEEQLKAEILVMVEWAKEQGVSITRACALLMMGRRRVVRWRRARDTGKGLENLKPGPTEPVHRLLPVERASVLQMAKKEEYADLSHRILAVTAWDQGLFFVSFSSVYRIMRSADLTSMRGVQGPHNGRSLPPVRNELTGPNQRWCWDISYLPTYEKGIFLYLYLLLDEYSRKAISWLVSWHQTAREAQRLLEEGLINENILDLPEDERPVVINDRGCQMKAKPIKRAPQYPGRFLDLDDAIQYFGRYVPWYNFEHYHSKIDYVTPDQCHRGLRDTIVSSRNQKLQQQRQLRKEVNRLNRIPLTSDEVKCMLDPNQIIPCSVIDP
jgi:putative transposase